MRKLIHLATAVVPILVWFLPRPAALILLTLGVTLALAVEWARKELRWVRYRFLRHTRHLLRRREKHGAAGATYLAVGYLAVFLLFPRSVAVLAMLYATLGDAAAALIGKRWGRHRLRWGKSWEGFAAGLSVNVLLGFLVPGITPPAAVLGALAAALLELLPIPVDDNLRVTIGGGTALWLSHFIPGFGG